MDSGFFAAGWKEDEKCRGTAVLTQAVDALSARARRRWTKERYLDCTLVAFMRSFALYHLLLDPSCCPI